MNKHGKLLVTCFKSRKQKKQQKIMSFTESVFSQETVAGVMTSPLEAENISFTNQYFGHKVQIKKKHSGECH